MISPYDYLKIALAGAWQPGTSGLVYIDMTPSEVGFLCRRHLSDVSSMKIQVGKISPFGKVSPCQSD